MPRDSEMNLDRWVGLMDAWGFGPNEETFQSLIAAYSEQGRCYHTTEHISACLRHLDRCQRAVDSLRRVEIALWFHDAIYEPLSSDNEKRSADWAMSFLEDNGAPDDDVAGVRRLVMATEHSAPASTKDEQILVDIDLSILGSTPSTYDVFERAVRQEYRLVPWLIYRKRRAAVLRGFLARPSIYTSGCFSEAVERQARDNLADAISKLE